MALPLKNSRPRGERGLKLPKVNTNQCFYIPLERKLKKYGSGVPEGPPGGVDFGEKKA